MTETGPMTLSIRLDSADLEATLARLAALLPTLPEGLSNIVDSFFNALNSGEKHLFTQSDLPLAGGASGVLLVFRPSDDLLEFMTAIGAGND